MKPLGERDSDSSASVNKLLATLRDHFGSVNCVRWAKCGRLIASGSDDQVILVHERRPGSGTTEFGSGEPPDVENWKVLLTLRGHTADVVLPFCLQHQFCWINNLQVRVRSVRVSRCSFIQAGNKCYSEVPLSEAVEWIDASWF